MKMAPARLSSINPATGAVFWEGEVASNELIQKTVNNAANAFSVWSYLDIEVREKFILTFQEIVKTQASDLAALITAENGKPLWEAQLEIQSVINKCDISIQAYHERCGNKQFTHGSATALLTHRPHGVVVVFSPFNFPFHLALGHIIPALLAGNTVILKPSELTPACGEAILRLWKEAGLPPHVFSCLQGGGDVGSELVQANVQGIFFTGSSATGHLIHQQLAGRPEVICALEMGGNNPLLVWDVADLEACAYQIIQSAFLTSGQRCSCARRLILPRGKTGEDLLQILITMIGKIIIAAGDSQPEPFMGPVINSAAASRIYANQIQWKSQGGVILHEMRQWNNTFLSPGLIDVTRIQVEDKECFGPLLQVIRVDTFDEGIQIANATAYGLVAGLFSDDEKYWEIFKNKSHAGVVNWNRPLTGALSQLPFGGVGYSGNHRPSAYYAADYCAYPIASLISPALELPQIKRGFHHDAF